MRHELSLLHRHTVLLLCQNIFLVLPSITFYSIFHWISWEGPFQAGIDTLRQQSSANWEMTNVCCWASEDASDPGSQLSSRMTNLFRLTHIIKCMSKILLTQSLFFPHPTADLSTFLALCCSGIIYFLRLGSMRLSQLNNLVSSRDCKGNLSFEIPVGVP